MNQPEIEFEHVIKRFGQTTVIPDLSFTINKGEFVTVLGSSGSGKTTTLKMINGLWQPTSGTVKIGGKELTEHTTKWTCGATSATWSNRLPSFPT